MSQLEKKLLDFLHENMYSILVCRHCLLKHTGQVAPHPAAFHNKDAQGNIRFVLRQLDTRHVHPQQPAALLDPFWRGRMELVAAPGGFLQGLFYG
jgi:hypothetical protein